MLPTNNEEADVIHDGFRSVFQQAIIGCQLTRRPWIWGSGDAEQGEFLNEPGVSSASDEPTVTAGPNPHATCFLTPMYGQGHETGLDA